MSARADEPGLLIVRAWFEDDGHAGRALRARITRSLGLLEPRDETVSSAASADEICETVRAWLADMRRAHPANGDNPITDA